MCDACPQMCMCRVCVACLQAAKVPTAILSTTVKARKRAKAKEEEKKAPKSSGGILSCCHPSHLGGTQAWPQMNDGKESTTGWLAWAVVQVSCHHTGRNLLPGCFVGSAAVTGRCVCWMGEFAACLMQWLLRTALWWAAWIAPGHAARVLRSSVACRRHCRAATVFTALTLLYTYCWCDVLPVAASMCCGR
jgi:hypothetical protein